MILHHNVQDLQIKPKYSLILNMEVKKHFNLVRGDAFLPTKVIIAKMSQTCEFGQPRGLGNKKAYYRR